MVKIKPFNDEYDPQIAGRVIRRYWFVIPVALAVCLLVAFLYVRYTPSVYEASSTVRSESQQNDQQIAGNVLGFSHDEKEVYRRLEYVKSSKFITMSLSKLPLSIDYFQRGRILDSELYKRAPFSVKINHIDSRLYETPITIQANLYGGVDLLFEIEGKSVKVPCVFNGDLCRVNNRYMDIELTCNIDKISDGEYYFVCRDINKAISTYMDLLHIDIANNVTGAIEIQCRYTDAIKAQDIVNTLATDFQQLDSARQREVTDQTLKYIDERLLGLEQELLDAEMELAIFQRDHHLDSTYSKADLWSENPSDLKKLVEESEKLGFEHRMLTKISETFRSSKDDPYVFLAQIYSSEYHGQLMSMITEMRSLMLQREKEKYEYTENSASVKRLDYQLEIQNKLIVETIKALQTNVLAKKQQVDDLVQERLAAVSHAGVVETEKSILMEQSKLRRVISIKQKFYDQLLEAKTNFEIRRTTAVSNDLILKASVVPTTPIYPNASKSYMIALLIALVASLGFIVYKYLIFNVIISAGEITKYVKDIAVLGVLPKYTGDMRYSQLLVDRSPKSMMAEAFRALKTNMHFLNNEKGVKVVAVTSTVSGEGKTFVAINLAGIVAYAGQKVIILDLDMRKPKIHKAFSEENIEFPNVKGKGVSDILAGIVTYQECVIHSRQENLDFITAGTIPPNPSELIMSDNMTALLAELKQKYDFIVLDNPPVGLVTDAMPNLQLADYPLYVFKSEYSLRPYIHNVDYLRNERGLTKLSVVFNADDSYRRKRKYGYGGYGRYGNYGRYGSYGHYGSYGYYGHYGYGYGYGYTDEKVEKTWWQRLMLKLFSKTRRHHRHHSKKK